MTASLHTPLNPASGSTVAAPSGGGAPTVPAAFFDDGAPRREMIANSPCLDVRDYPAHSFSHGDAAGVGSFPPHSAGVSE